MRLNADIPSAPIPPAVVPSAVVIDLPQAENSVPIGAEHRLDPDLLQQNRIVGFNQANELAHPYVVLRSQLLKHAKISGMRTFAITSVQPGNGKTHVAVNLSAALSRLHPTILVDLDLRRPSVGKSLGLCERQSGIDDFLNGDIPLSQSAVRIGGFDLSVHQVREHRNNAEDLLASSHLSDLIAMVRTAENSPICIIDTPPALVHDDLMLIARIIDGVLMVVEEGRTPRQGLKDTISALSPTPVVGSILNMSISSPHEARYYSYESAAAKPSLLDRFRSRP